jgi:uncharacterized RmlC-like cupin family protein
VIDGPPAMPFPPRRLYYIHNVAPAARRGCHAHKIEQELIIAITGRFKITVKDDRAETEFELHTPHEALYVPPMIWHELHDFAPGSVCAVLASVPFDPSDYIHRYDEYVALLHRGAA